MDRHPHDGDDGIDERLHRPVARHPRTDAEGDERQPGFFSRFARRTSEVVGTPWVFMVAVLLVVVWALSGPVFSFSSTWQLVINTGTTIITFLMVFLIQSSQNRDSRALHLKLDAIIDAFDAVREDMVDVEDASDEELEAAREHFKRRREASDEPPLPAPEDATSETPDAHANGAYGAAANGQ